MEETTREREERLKGWSTFLDGDVQAKQNNATQSAEGAASTDPAEASSTAEPEQQQHSKSEPQQQEQEVDSTDSSLAGSDDEDA